MLAAPSGTAWDIGNVKDWGTFVGAVVAAATGVWNLWRQVREKRDRFRVGLGTVSPSITREAMLYVVSHSEHTIKLSDWGFIEADGRFVSIPMEIEVDPGLGEEATTRGSSELAARGSVFEAGYERQRDPAGAFAASVTRRRPQIYLSNEMPLWRRACVRSRLLFQPRYLQ